MRRLEILLVGHSLALSELARELELHGHAIARLESLQSLPECLPQSCNLLIEDGSLELPACLQQRFGAITHLGLRLDLGEPGENGLPTLEWLCWTGTARAQRLIERQAVTQDLCGNGQVLRSQVMTQLVDSLALQVSRFSRNPEHFLDAAPAEAPRHAQQQGLAVLDALAYTHRLNQTHCAALLAQAERPLIEHLEQSLQQFAERPALSVDGHTLCYRQLRELSLAIQQQLLPLLAPHDPAKGPPVVALCLPKCAALYAAILATLGCAAVYLPLEPSHPLQRQQFILENAGAKVLLHDGWHPLAGTLASLDIGQIAPLPGSASQRLMRHRPDSDAPCMALYTSGTTGQPKGVLVSQRNLSHFTCWYAGHVQLSEHSRALQFSSLSFDSSLIDIFPTLICGAELVVPSEDQRRDPLQLVELIRQRQLSHAFLPPALLSLLPLDQPLGLTHLMTGGDVCEPYVIERLAGQCHLHNLYGPTEATVLVTARRLAPGDHNRRLGVPIANSQVLILDEELQPVPENTAGELYISGPGVCLGYLNNPELTAERYRQLTLPDGQCLKVYRTGDIGKWTAEGIELCGRLDNQVKIRGMRVEPEEIEQCLRDSQLYRQIAVVVDAQRRILAFLAQPQAHASQSALRAHVEQRLPDYMQPMAYLELASMPYASNGKIDRKALLEMPVSVGESRARRLPESTAEQQLLELWSELLELPTSAISTDESFFNLGGHSILLSKMLLSLREQFGRSISINRFIEDPTIVRQALLLSGAGANAEAGTLSRQAFQDAWRELDLQVLPLSQMGDVHKVIVTGANSFVGVHIVEALLDWGASEVACLVRESAGQSATERFTQALRDNRLEGLDLSRVQVYPADLTQPLLGLDPQAYERLDREYGALVHNAANVNHVMDYETLAADNVEPIFECLRLCEGRSKKIFNFVSTLSASSTIDADGFVLEHPPAETPPIYIRNGYNLSKWVGERILQRACEQGVRVNLYRPGNISFNSRTGVCQPHKNRLMLMLKGSLQLGQVPDFSLNFDLMPVDFLARFIAFHSSRYQPHHAVFNLHNPEPLSWDGYVASFREAGRDFEMVSIAQWQQQLSRVDGDNALFGVLGFYLDGFEEDIGDISRIGHDNALAGVLLMGEHYPHKTPALLRKGCEYLKEIQFI